jgi:hypothetical protein
MRQIERSAMAGLWHYRQRLKIELANREAVGEHTRFHKTPSAQDSELSVGWEKEKVR